MTWWLVAIWLTGLTLLLAEQLSETSTLLHRKSSSRRHWSVANRYPGPRVVLQLADPVLENNSISLFWSDGERTDYKWGCDCEMCVDARKVCPNLDAAVAARFQDKKLATEEAAMRAKELLISLLDETQRHDFERDGMFMLKSQRGRRYSIRTGYSGNVVHIRDRKHYCCYLNAEVPVYDHMIGQLLALKYNEDLFLKTAY